MSVAPNAGVVDLDTFLPPTSSDDGQQGQVPKPLAGQENHVLSASGWIPSSSGSGTVTSVAATAGTGIAITGSPITTSGTLNITNTAPDQTTGTLAGLLGGKQYTNQQDYNNAFTSLVNRAQPDVAVQLALVWTT